MVHHAQRNAPYPMLSLREPACGRHPETRPPAAPGAERLRSARPQAPVSEYGHWTDHCDRVAALPARTAGRTCRRAGSPTSCSEEPAPCRGASLSSRQLGDPRSTRLAMFHVKHRHPGSPWRRWLAVSQRWLRRYRRSATGLKTTAMPCCQHWVRSETRTTRSSQMSRTSLLGFSS